MVGTDFADMRLIDTVFAVEMKVADACEVSVGNGVLETSNDIANESLQLPWR